MWETLVRPPRGRVSARKFIAFFATLLVAVFGYTLLSSTPVFAADAQWKTDDTITHEGKDYKGVVQKKTGDPTTNIPNGALTFQLFEPGNDPTKGKLSVIFFQPNVPDYLRETSASFITYDYTDNRPNGAFELANPSSITTIPVTPRAPPSAPTQGQTACVLDGIGWIVCPISKAIAEAMDYLYDIVTDFFKVEPLAPNQGDIYKMWGVFRGVANILFVIGFLIIIYGQISGSLLNNYSIKKLLPRLVIAAVMVNLSYWICAIAVDISNILGYAVIDLFDNLQDITGAPNSEVAAKAMPTWASVAAAILGGGALLPVGGAALIVATGTSTGLAFLLLTVLLPAIFAVLVAVAILAARQALITIFIIIAPLAFVAYLLPNTEEWFTRWRKTFTTMLIMFPAFSVIFGGAQLTGTIIIINAPNVPVILLGLAVQVVPLFITPFLVKLSSGLMATVANMTNDRSKGVFDRAKLWANERRNDEIAKGNRRLSAQNQAGTLSTNRLNPRRMAYNRVRNKMAREGERAANEALTKGYFTQTAAGQRIHRLNERAKMEQGIGDNENQASWENEVRTSPNLRARALRSHDAHERAALYKGEVDAAASEHWQHSLATNAGLRTIQSKTYTASGRAKLTEEALKNADERTLQTQINTDAHLRGMKVQSDVDAAHAQFQAANVAAEGKATFQNEVYTSPALQQMNTETVSFEKQASTMENTLKQRAEESWERTSKTDAHLQNLRLNEVQATDKHKKAEAQWNSLIENIRITGGNTPGVRAQNRGVASSIRQLTPEVFAEEATTKALQSIVQSKSQQDFSESNNGRILNIRSQAAADALEATQSKEKALIQEWRTEKGSEGLTSSEATLAQALQDADTQKRAQAQRAMAASSLTDQEYAGKVRSDDIIPGGTETIAEVAASVTGATGMSQAKARATQTIFKAFDEYVDAEKTLVSRNSPTDVLGEEIPDPSDPSGATSIGLGNANILDEPEERIAALAGRVASDHHHESQVKLWQRMGELGRQANDELEAAQASGDQAAIAKARDRVGKVKSLEQQVYGDKSRVPFGAGATDQGDIRVGRYAGNIYNSTRARIMTHLSAETLAGMDPDDIRLIFEMGRAGELNEDELDQINKAYKDWQEDDNLKARIQPKHRILLDPLSSHATTGNADAYPKESDYPAGSGEARLWKTRYQEGIDSMTR